MKILLCLFLLCSASLCQAQTVKDENLIAAGNELKTFSRKYATGVTMSLIGAGSAVVGASAEVAAPVYIGGALVLVGTVISISAHSHIGMAGKYLSGNGVAIPIEGKKHKKAKHRKE